MTRQLIAWSIRTGRRDQALIHLVSHVEAAKTACGCAIVADWWKIAEKRIGEPSCPRCVQILRQRIATTPRKEQAQ